MTRIKKTFASFALFYQSMPVTHIKDHLLKISSHERIFYKFDTVFDRYKFNFKL